MEAWTRKDPSLQHLFVYGCEAYDHVPKKKWLKFDKKEVTYNFIGYGVSVKGYNI